MDFLRIGTKIRNYNNLQKFIHANLYIFLRKFCLLRVKYPAYKNLYKDTPSRVGKE